MSRGGVHAANYVLHISAQGDGLVALCGRRGGNFFGRKEEAERAAREALDSCCKACRKVFIRIDEHAALAAPDSDARLREVIRRARELGFDRGLAAAVDPSADPDLQDDVDKVLGRKP